MDFSQLRIQDHQQKQWSTVCIRLCTRRPLHCRFYEEENGTVIPVTAYEVDEP